MNVTVNEIAKICGVSHTMTIGIVAINVDNMVSVESLSALNQEAARCGHYGV